MDQGRRQLGRLGFTLIELLVVLTIIVIVSVIALPTVVNSLSHRQSSQAARILQGAIAGARSDALRSNAPAGIRLLVDPVANGINPATGQLDPRLPLASNRIIPISVPPDYSDGAISIFPPSSYPDVVRTVTTPQGQAAVGVPCLVVEESLTDANGVVQAPTNWFWNIRVGEKLRIGQSGPWYTIVGPMAVVNPELFVNVGPAGTPSPLQRGANLFPEFLLLVNGRDDNGDGWIDNGFDGVDNNGNGLIDEAAEWIEVERWLGSLGEQIGP